MFICCIDRTTNETSSNIHGLIDISIKQEHEIIDLGSPTTPTMKSIGTMPRTPTMISTGTMPKTPTMVSTGTMPKTPTMVSTGTMPKTPTTMASSFGSVNEIIDLCSSATSTIDLVSPTIEMIDLCSADTPTTYW